MATARSKLKLELQTQLGTRTTKRVQWGAMPGLANDRRRLFNARVLTVTNNTFQFTIAQVSGLNYIVQGNTNLSTTNWVAIVTNTAPFTITDAAFTNNPQRFYRALYKP